LYFFEILQGKVEKVSKKKKLLILFGPGFANRLAGLQGVQYFFQGPVK